MWNLVVGAVDGMVSSSVVLLLWSYLQRIAKRYVTTVNCFEVIMKPHQEQEHHHHHQASPLVVFQSKKK